MPKTFSFEQLKSHLDEAAKQGNPQPDIEIHSVDLSIYVAFLRERDTLTPLGDEASQTRFPSQFALQRRLAECGLQRATLIHTSAYGEMVGLPTEPNASTELRQVVHLL